ncbi:helix-turn-helix domain-containing protein [Rhizobium rhizogenes]|uniref:AraC family transcriptional regulator n=1 Tax=Rhizobium rhizogenes TaxID=359 RepID=UPI001A9C668A|nr:helix-turn-helix domain-containing protein [Rhizobium rhizogenes]
MASRKGQRDVQQLFTIHRASKPRGAGLPLHAHDEAQLIFAASGMVQVHTERGVWLVPPQLVGWIPGGVPHRLDILSDAELWLVLMHKQALQNWAPPSFPDRAFVSRIAPLLRALLDEAVAIDPTSDKAELVVRLILYELTAMQDAPTFLPLPQSTLGRRLAEIAIADHRNALDLSDLASRAATSVRSASRLFPTETGMTLKAWRQRVRIVWAMEQLSRGESIARVATQAGFASTAAFSAAFRQVTAMTPTAFLGDPTPAA